MKPSLIENFDYTVPVALENIKVTRFSYLKKKPHCLNNKHNLRYRLLKSKLKPLKTKKGT